MVTMMNTSSAAAKLWHVEEELRRARKGSEVVAAVEQAWAASLERPDEIALPYATVHFAVERCGRFGHGLDAGKLVRMMKQRFGTVRRSTLSLAVAALVRQRKVIDAMELLHETWAWCSESKWNLEELDRIRPDEKLCAMVANAAVEEKRVDWAVMVLTEMQNQGVPLGNFSYTVLLKGYGRSGKIKAVRTLANLCLDRHQMKEAPDLVLANTVVDALVRCGEWDEASEMFQKFRATWNIEPDIRTYNTLLKGLAEAGKLEEAFGLREEIQRIGLEPNEVTRNTLVSACVRMGRWEKAEALLDEIGDRLPVEVGSIFAFTSMVHGLAMAGRIDEAFGYVNQLEKEGIPANLVTYTALITSYIHVGEVAKAWFLFRGMRKVDLVPDEATYKAMISGLAKRGNLRSMDAVQSLFDEMQEKSMNIDEDTYNSVMNGYVKIRRMDSAEDVFRMLETHMQPSIVSYSTLLRGYGFRQDMVQAKRIFREMRKRGIPPDRIALNTFLSTCVRCKDMTLARRVFAEMDRSGGHLTPDVVTFGAMTLGYAHLGDWERAWSCYEEMKSRNIQPSGLLLNRLFKYCTDGLLPIERGYELVEDMKAAGLPESETSSKRSQLKPLLMIASEVWKKKDGKVEQTSVEDELFERHGWNEIDSSFRPI